ncbi:MAG: hypothetical protein HQM12_03285 [SAR324 cluster bacterium]|nr:hypothetical protein [SAR324 cluster bacterium]
MNATEINKTVEQTIEQTVTTVESIHKTLVNRFFEILERMEALRNPVKQARELHDKATGSVYSQIRKISKIVSDYVSSLLPEHAEVPKVEAHSSAAKATNTTKPVAKKATKKSTPVKQA